MKFPLPTPGTPSTIACILAFVWTCGHAGAQSSSDRLDAELLLALAPHALPGASAMVVKGGQIVAQGAAGLRRFGNPAPLDPDDAVNIGSCTKWMTATLAGRLVDQGVIAWTTRIADVFPNFAGFNAAYHDVTLEQLLAHRGGVPEAAVWEPRFRSALDSRTGTVMELRRWVADVTLADRPQVARGTELYSNQGYSIAAVMLELRTGRSWESLMVEQVFRPLNMSSARIGRTVEDDWLPPAGVVGHDMSGVRPVPRAAMAAGAFLRYQASNGPAGMVVCTLRDWSRFLRAVSITANGYLEPGTAVKLRTPFTGEVGYGLGVGVFNRSWEPAKAFNHTGDILGQTSLFWIAPTHDLIVTVYSNVAAQGSSSGVFREAVATALIARYKDAAPFGPFLDGTQPTLPTITTQPGSQVTAVGQPVTFSAGATGSGLLTYQWSFNDVPIPGATRSSLTLGAAAPSDAGFYSVRVANSAGAIDSAAAALTIEARAPTNRLSNLAVLTRLAAGRRLSVGYNVAGGPKPLLFRAVGPGLAAVGVAEPMRDPRLVLYAESRTVAENDNWLEAPALSTASRLVGAFPLGVGSLDAALIRTTGGRGSVEVSGLARGENLPADEGTVLVEVYDADSAASPRLTNLSVLNDTAAGSPLSAGFTVMGTGAKTLLVRAIGPGLSGFGVTGPLQNPRVDVFAADTTRLAASDDWDPSLTSTFRAVGAFNLAEGSLDAALLVSVGAGSYFVQVSSADGTSGAALLEIYEVL